MMLFFTGLEFTLSTTSKGNSDGFAVLCCGTSKYRHFKVQDQFNITDSVA